MLAPTRFETCADLPASLTSCRIVKSAPHRFGSRMRRQAARGRCYACDRGAVGVAPIGAAGRCYVPGKPYTLRPACPRHQWAEWLHQGAKRPDGAIVDEPACYVAESFKPNRAFRAGFKVTRQDTGEIVLCGDGEGRKRTYWKPLTGQIILESAIRPEILRAVEAGESAVWSPFGQEIASCGQWTDFPEWAGPCPDGAEDPSVEISTGSDFVRGEESLEDEGPAYPTGLTLPEGFSEAWREVSDRNVSAFAEVYGIGYANSAK